MSEFGGLFKHEKTLRALIGLGNAALAAAVRMYSLTQVRRPEFPERDNKVCTKEIHVSILFFVNPLFTFVFLVSVLHSSYVPNFPKAII